MCAFGSVLGIKSEKSLMLRLAVIMRDWLTLCLPQKSAKLGKKCKNNYIS